MMIFVVLSLFSSPSTTKTLVIVQVVEASGLPCILVSPWLNVFGQTDFTSNTPGAGLNQLTLPYDVKIDPVSVKIFVVDTNNNRLLRFEENNS